MSLSWEPAIAQTMQQHGGRNRPCAHVLSQPAPAVADQAAGEARRKSRTVVIVHGAAKDAQPRKVEAE